MKILSTVSLLQVEDKRIEMEKRMLSMQVKYDSVLKAYNCVKTQLHNMKVCKLLKTYIVYM